MLSPAVVSGNRPVVARDRAGAAVPEDASKNNESSTVDARLARWPRVRDVGAPDGKRIRFGQHGIIELRIQSSQRPLRRGDVRLELCRFWIGVAPGSAGPGLLGRSRCRRVSL
jgi:hypothetical protein